MASFSSVASIVYFALYFALVIVLTFKIQRKETGMKNILKCVWRQRAIYAPILVHIYDTATDVGIIIDWAEKAKQERNGEAEYNTINMNTFFIAAVSFFILYRIISIATIIHRCDKQVFVDVILAALDLYIIKVVYSSIKKKDAEAGSKQKMYQLMESVFESLPQVILQSVFIIRSVYFAEELQTSSNFQLVIISLIASLFSISNKYVWLDETGTAEDAHELSLRKRCDPICLNYKYVLRVIWRFVTITVRFVILSLCWVVLGGWLWSIYFALNFIIWSVSYFFKDRGNSERANPFILSLIALISSVVSKSWIILTIRCMDAMIMLIIITIFAFNASWNCPFCADSDQRQALNAKGYEGNDYIFSFIMAGWLCFVLDITLYFLFMRGIISQTVSEKKAFEQFTQALQTETTFNLLHLFIGEITEWDTASDMIDNRDVSIRIKYQSFLQDTKIVKGNKRISFNEPIILEVLEDATHEEGQTLQIEVWDVDTTTADDLLAIGEIDVYTQLGIQEYEVELKHPQSGSVCGLLAISQLHFVNGRSGGIRQILDSYLHLYIDSIENNLESDNIVQCRIEYQSHVQETKLTTMHKHDRADKWREPIVFENATPGDTLRIELLDDKSTLLCYVEIDTMETYGEDKGSEYYELTDGDGFKFILNGQKDAKIGPIGIGQIHFVKQEVGIYMGPRKCCCCCHNDPRSRKFDKLLIHM